MVKEYEAAVLSSLAKMTDAAIHDLKQSHLDKWKFLFLDGANHVLPSLIKSKTPVLRLDFFI